MARIRGEHAAVGVEGSVEQQPIDALVVMEGSAVPQVRRRGADMRVLGRRAVRGDLHAVLASSRGLCSLRVQLPMVTSGNRLLWLRHYVPAARGGCTGVHATGTSGRPSPTCTGRSQTRGGAGNRVIPGRPGGGAPGGYGRCRFAPPGRR